MRGLTKTLPNICIRRGKRKVDVEGVEEEMEGYFAYSRREKVNGDVVWTGVHAWKGHVWDE
jgi:hypothetical protein